MPFIISKPINSKWAPRIGALHFLIKSIDSAYNAAIEDGGSVFVSTYSTQEQAISNIKNIMITAHEPIVSINIPITVSVGKGDNWEEAH